MYVYIYKYTYMRTYIQVHIYMYIYIWTVISDPRHTECYKLAEATQA